MDKYVSPNATGVNSGAGTAYPSRAPGFTSGFQWDWCYSVFSFMRMLCRSLFVLLYLFFWTLCCLFFFDIPILIPPLISYNSSSAFLEHMSSHQGISGVRVTRSLGFCAVFCVTFILLSFFIWPLFCLSVDLRLLITPLASSSFSCFCP